MAVSRIIKTLSKFNQKQSSGELQQNRTDAGPVCIWRSRVYRHNFTHYAVLIELDASAAFTLISLVMLSLKLSKRMNNDIALYVCSAMALMFACALGITFFAGTKKAESSQATEATPILDERPRTPTP